MTSKRCPLVAVASLLAAVLCLWMALETPVVTDLSAFLPRSGTTAQLLQEVRAGPAAHLILVGLEGASAQSRAEASRQLARRLKQTGLFARVANGEMGRVSEEQRRLFAYRYLLSAGVTRESFQVDALRQALEQRLRELASPFSVLHEDVLAADPTGEFVKLLSAWQSQKQPDTAYGVWFSPDGRRALLLLETYASGFDPDAQEKVVETIEAAFAEIAPAQGVRLLLSGAAVFAVLSRDTIRFEAQVLSVAASAFVVLLLWINYRSPRIVLLSVVPLVAGILAAMAVVGLVFGKLYAITLAFGVTLLGVAIDYPIHLFSHLGAAEPVERCLGRIWPTLRLGVMTTALGYSAMITNEFTGLAQLATFAIAGLLAAAACTRWLLPCLMAPMGTALPVVRDGTVWLEPLLSPRRTVTLMSLLTGLAAIAYLVLDRPLLWEDNLAALSPVPARAIVLDQGLRSALGAPETSHLVVVSGKHVESTLQRSEWVGQRLRSLVEAGVLGGFESPAHYLPSQLTQERRKAVLPERAQLAQALDLALKALPFKAGSFEPFVAAVASTRTLDPLTPEDLAGTGLDSRLASLLLPASGEWLALLPLHGVHDSKGLAQALWGLDEQGVTYLNIRQETEALMAAFRDAALMRLAWGCGLIVLVLWLGLGSLVRAMAVLLPVFLAISLDLAVLSWAGEHLSLFHLVSLLLVLGIGIDYSLFFSRPDGEPEVRRRTLHAVLVCSGSTLAVFGMLALSRLPALEAIGRTVSMGVLASLWMSWALARPMAAANWRRHKRR